MRRYSSLLYYLLVGVACLGACDGGSGENLELVGSDNGVTVEHSTPSLMQGHVVIEERSERFHLDAWFTRGTPTEGVEVELLYELAGDACYRVDDASSWVMSDLEIVSAGEAVSLTSRSGTWAELPRQTGLGAPVYMSELRSIRDPWPDDVLLEIPGDEFPEIFTTALDSLSALKLLAPVDDRNVPSDRRLAWQASTDDRDQIDLVMRAESAGGNTGERFSVECQLVDDGDFVVPEFIAEQVDWISRVARSRKTVNSAENASLTVVQVSER